MAFLFGGSGVRSCLERLREEYFDLPFLFESAGVRSCLERVRKDYFDMPLFESSGVRSCLERVLAGVDVAHAARISGVRRVVGLAFVRMQGRLVRCCGAWWCSVCLAVRAVMCWSSIRDLGVLLIVRAFDDR